MRGCKYVCYKKEGSNEVRKRINEESRNKTANNRNDYLEEEVNFLGKRMKEMINRMQVYETERTRSTLMNPTSGVSWAEVASTGRPNRENTGLTPAPNDVFWSIFLSFLSSP